MRRSTQHGEDNTAQRSVHAGVMAWFEPVGPVQKYEVLGALTDRLLVFLSCTDELPTQAKSKLPCQRRAEIVPT